MSGTTAPITPPQPGNKVHRRPRVAADRRLLALEASKGAARSLGAAAASAVIWWIRER
ncbi:hypothetical protein ACIP9H_39260 [Streptomyces sp. NPDC088732]|uniref:hypothetical protein n=1 Tax=Streptomyces sp. NPDC088732 TaxID=3365879 RepID=UPI00381A4D8F